MMYNPIPTEENSLSTVNDSGRIALNSVKIIYIVVAALISVYYLVIGKPFSSFLGPVSLLFLLIPPVLKRLLKIQLGNYVSIFLLLFCCFAFQLGVALRFYDIVEIHDIIAHLLSGIFFACIGLCLYAKLSPHFTGRTSDFLLQVSYAFFFSMAIASLWEVGEFIGYSITGHDMQHHLDTGVIDTMEDIIACLIGTLIACGDFFLCFKKKKRFPLGIMVSQFDHLNHLGEQ